MAGAEHAKRGRAGAHPTSRRAPARVLRAHGGEGGGLNLCPAFGGEVEDVVQLRGERGGVAGGTSQPVLPSSIVSQAPPWAVAATILGPESGEELDWTYGLPGARLANALREWQVTELPGDYYQMLNASDGDIVTLFKAFGIDVPAKIYTKGDLRELKSSVDPF